MRRLFYTLILFLFFSSTAVAQTPQWLWTTTAYGVMGPTVIGIDGTNPIATDKAGNVYVVGTYTDAGMVFGSTYLGPFGILGEDIFLAKYSPTGSLIWLSYAGTMWPGDMVRAIAVDTGGNIYIAGNCAAGFLAIGPSGAIAAIRSIKLQRPQLPIPMWQNTAAQAH